MKVKPVRYLFLAHRHHTGVCEKTHLGRTNKCGKTSFQSAKSGAGLQFLRLDCRERARIKGVCFTDTGMNIILCVICNILYVCMLFIATSMVARPCRHGLVRHAREYECVDHDRQDHVRGWRNTVE